MSEVLDWLVASEDPLENDLAGVLRHWQDVKLREGRRRTLGYEPRDINAYGAVEVISRRVLKGSTGFEEVDREQSYEALVLKHSEQFSSKVISTAKMRVSNGVQAARIFQAQEIKFFIKARSQELFGDLNIEETEEGWLSRKAAIPTFTSDFSFADPLLKDGFRSLVWLHQEEKNGESGKGLTAIVEFGPMDNQRKAKVIEAFFFPHRIGNEILEKHRNDDDLLGRLRGYNHTKIWPITENAISILLSAMQNKAQQIADFNNPNSDPYDPENTEGIEEKTSLRKVVLRQFQAAFRRELLLLRPNRCAITGTGEVSVLDAAHIIPYAAKHPDRDRPENGLLLRRDIHKLFDAGLISIEPECREVRVSRRLQSEEYTRLSGTPVNDDVSEKSLKYHFDQFSER